MLGHKLKSRNIEVERDYGDGDLEVEGYPGELNQVWTNLIDNAIDAMDDGGKLTVAVAAEGDETVIIRIVDIGHGIPPDIQARIFEPFFTTKDVGDGSGLGLDIVDRIIRNLHQGSITIDSKPGRTEFTIRLTRAH
jgi:signal transduction histidine kinase